MTNSLLFVGWAVLGLFILLLIFRFFGKIGVTAFIGASVVIMNILVTKSMIIFGVGSTGGNVLYAAIFLATDLLSEYYGGKEARKAVIIGFACSVFSLIAVSVTLLFEPASWDWAHPPLAALFTPVARIVAGSMIAYLISQNLDTYTYDFIRRRFKALWLRVIKLEERVATLEGQQGIVPPVKERAGRPINGCTCDTEAGGPAFCGVHGEPAFRKPQPSCSCVGHVHLQCQLPPSAIRGGHDGCHELNCPCTTPPTEPKP